MESMSLWIVLLAIATWPFNGLAYEEDELPADEDACELPKDEQSPAMLTIFEGRRAIFEPLHFIYFNKDVAKATMKNDGKTLTIEISPDSQQPSFGGGPLARSNKFRLHIIRFRWGIDDTEGSDHIIDGQSYPIEMQLIHYNVKFPTYEEALRQYNGIAVLSFLFKTGKNKNPNFDGIVSKLSSVRHSGRSTKIPLGKISDLMLPGAEWQTNYFTYEGTLTPPHCHKSVTWLVFRTPIKISSEQASRFRQLNDVNGEPLRSHSEPLPLGDRQEFLCVQKHR